MHLDKRKKYWMIELICLLLNILRFFLIAGIVVFLLILVIF